VDGHKGANTMSTKELILKEIEQLHKEIERLSDQSVTTDVLNSVQKFRESLTQNKRISEGDFEGWEGCLAHLKDKYTSVELQHKIKELR
jgi:tRNA splicing ligase